MVIGVALAITIVEAAAAADCIGASDADEAPLCLLAGGAVDTAAGRLSIDTGTGTFFGPGAVALALAEVAPLPPTPEAEPELEAAAAAAAKSACPCSKVCTTHKPVRRLRDNGHNPSPSKVVVVSNAARYQRVLSAIYHAHVAESEFFQRNCGMPAHLPMNISPKCVAMKFHLEFAVRGTCNGEHETIRRVISQIFRQVFSANVVEFAVYAHKVGIFHFSIRAPRA
jgi:hypothetical protein